MATEPHGAVCLNDWFRNQFPTLCTPNASSEVSARVEFTGPESP